jgi:diguanylate cyclase (GGDEF)-like protein
MPQVLADPSIDQLIAGAWELRHSDHERFKELSDEGLRRSEEGAYLAGRGYALRNLGYYQFVRSSFDPALECLKEGYSIGHQLADQVLTRDCANFIGGVYNSLGDFEIAAEYVREVVEISKELGDIPAQISSLMNLGVLHHQLGQDEAAQRPLHEALERSRQIGDQGREALVLINLGTNRLGLRRHQEAYEILLEALALVQGHGMDESLHLVYINMGEALGYLGHHEEALRVLELARQGREGSHKEGVCYCHLNIGRIHIAQQHHAQALSELQTGLAMAQHLGLKNLEMQFYQLFAEAHKGLAQFAKALDCFERFHALEHELRSFDNERRIRSLSLHYELDRAKAEAEIERLRNGELKQLLDALQAANNKNDRLVKELERQVLQDPLTTLFNRRHLEATLEAEFTLARQGKRPLPVSILDIDNFKRINDTFSHQTGDLVLQTVAELMRINTRTSDIVARYGGEEFVMVFPDTTPEQAAGICERFRMTVEHYDWSRIHPNLSVTLSMGLAHDTSLSHHEHLLHLADERLYKAKNSGKNRLVYG